MTVGYGTPARRTALQSAGRPHERRSTLVTTNLAFSEWVQVFGDEKLTTALLDRLGHHAHILTTRGHSYRTRKRPDAGAPVGAARPTDGARNEGNVRKQADTRQAEDNTPNGQDGIRKKQSEELPTPNTA